MFEGLRKMKRQKRSFSVFVTLPKVDPSSWSCKGKQHKLTKRLLVVSHCKGVGSILGQTIFAQPCLQDF